MKVHFITSKITPDNSVETLRKVIVAIRKAGHEIADDWLEVAYERDQDPNREPADWPAIYRKNIGTIAKADVVIAEATHDSFAVGYQTAAAIQQKKPVLLLRNSTAEKDRFISGVVEEWAHREEYSDATLDSIIKKFLDDNTITTKDMRFNFFINRQIYNYLRWAAFKTGRTKADILRALVEQEIEKKEY